MKCGHGLFLRPSIPVRIPTIGIGASAACDGQILVMEDMLGLSPRVAKFVKEFGQVGAAIESAIESYADEVRTRTFPAPEHTYAMKASAAPDAATDAGDTKKTKKTCK